MLRKTKKLIPFILPTLALVLPAVVLAQNPPACTGSVAGTGSLVPCELGKTGDVVAVVRAIIRFIILIAFVIAFIMLLVGGIRWILAGGDEKGVEKARGTITAALIGLVVVLIAFALIRLVEIFFNVPIITGIKGLESIPTVGQ